MSTQQLNYVTKKLILVALLLTPFFAQAACESVWSGTVERLRYYDQSGVEKVMVYLFPGSNANYVGFTSSKTHGSLILKTSSADCPAMSW